MGTLGNKNPQKWELGDDSICNRMGPWILPGGKGLEGRQRARVYGTRVTRSRRADGEESMPRPLCNNRPRNELQDERMKKDGGERGGKGFGSLD